MKNLKVLFLSVLCLSLCSCVDVIDGSGSGSSVDSREIAEVNPEGIWSGYQTIIGVDAYDMQTIIYDGKILGISEDAGVLYSGTYGMESKKFLISNGQEGSDQKYMLYDIYNKGLAFARGIVSISVDEKDSFQGVFSNENNQEGEVGAVYSPVFERGADLSYISGDHTEDYLDISVSETGVISGTVGLCDIAGDAVVPEAEKNVYAISFSLSGCDYEGDYEGLGFVSVVDDVPYFSALADTGSRMVYFGYGLDATPDIFTMSVSEMRAAKAEVKEKTSSSAYDYFSSLGKFSFSLPYYYDWDNITIDEIGEDHSSDSYFLTTIYMNTYDSDYSYSTFSSSRVLLSSYVDSGTRRIDNSDFSHSTFNFFHLVTSSDFSPKSDYIFNQFEERNLDYSDVFAIADSDFRYIEASDSDFEMYAYNTDFSHSNLSSNTIYGYFESCNFTQADFSDATIGYIETEGDRGTTEKESTSILFSNLEGVDFRNADLYGVSIGYSALNYANFTDAKGPETLSWRNNNGTNTIGNAWWIDGSRCNAASIALCLPKVYDNGLTYEEYLAGKTDLEKDKELIQEAANNIIHEGKEVVKDVVSWGKKVFRL